MTDARCPASDRIGSDRIETRASAPAPHFRTCRMSNAECASEVGRARGAEQSRAETRATRLDSRSMCLVSSRLVSMRRAVIATRSISAFSRIHPRGPPVALSLLTCAVPIAIRFMCCTVHDTASASEPQPQPQPQTTSERNLQRAEIRGAEAAGRGSGKKEGRVESSPRRVVGDRFVSHSKNRVLSP